MSYFGFLALFLLTPIVIFGAFAYRDHVAKFPLKPELAGRSPWGLLGLLVVIAVVWTTPWDNYLVATRVWWYDESLVTGIVLGWVPIEEYCFFVLQPIMTGLILVFFARRMPSPPKPFVPDKGFVRIALGLVLIGWVASAWLLFFGPKAGTYLGLELIWALPPIAIQVGFGADILRYHWRIVTLTIGLTTLYLASADALAIQSGTWTIDPEQSFVNLKIGGLLPIEELIFFLLTNILCTFGLLLGIASPSQSRLPARWRAVAAESAP